VAALGFGYAHFEGYQQNPYAFVQVGADDLNPIRATHPRRRQRQVATLSYKQGLAEGLASQIDYRYYADDWEVVSHTLELTLSQRIGPLVLEPSFRRYWQPQGAYFFRNYYANAQQYMSRDLKLAPHETRMISMTLRGEFGGGFGGLLNYAYYTRQDQLDYGRYYAGQPETASLIQLVLTYQ
jgi:hypothetical protein